MLLIFTIPLLDLLIVTLHRIKIGVPPTTGGTDHISHRLLATGLSEVKVLATFSIYSICCFTFILFSIISNRLLAYTALFLYFTLFVFGFIRAKRMEILD